MTWEEEDATEHSKTLIEENVANSSLSGHSN